MTWHRAAWRRSGNSLPPGDASRFPISMPTMDDSGMVLMTRGCNAHGRTPAIVISGKKPGPSLEYTRSNAILYAAGWQNADAYTAKLPPLECPPTSSGYAVIAIAVVQILGCPDLSRRLV